MWYVVPLLGNDREICKYAAAVTRQRPVNNSGGTVFPTRSVPKYYKQGNLGAGVSWITAGVQLLWEAGSWGRGQFGNQEEGERPQLKAATKQRQWRRECGH
jgi:hypothetical protein